MSKNIAIKEGDTAKSFNGVKKIKINNVGSGSSYWVPEDETVLGTKHITENGTYKASEEVDDQEQSKNWYGYSEVTVSGIGTVTGIGADGNEHTMTKDDDGNLVDKTVPSSIRFTRAPFRIVYNDGDDIDTTGAIVCGYTKKGDLWTENEDYPQGVIPLNELTLDPTKADYEKSSKTNTRESDLDISESVFTMPIPYQKTDKASDSDYEYRATSPTGNVIYATGGVTELSQSGNMANYIILFTSSAPFRYMRIDRISGSSDIFTTNQTYTNDGKTIYYSILRYGGVLTGNIDKISPNLQTLGSFHSSPNYMVGQITRVAWTTVYGDIVSEAGQEINVSWKRVGDQKKLETTLMIQVMKEDEE